MLTAEAHVATDRASRYLTQLCRHLGEMGRHRGHRPGAHGGGDVMTRPEIQHVDYSETIGIVRTTLGRFTLQATDDTLRLRAEADDEQDLRRLQTMLAARIEKIGRRDGLTVAWRPHEASTARAAEAYAGPAAAAPRNRRQKIGLIAVAALAVAVHLGLLGAAFESSGWTSMTIDVVLAGVVVKLIALSLGGRFAFLRRRHKVHH